MESNFKQLIFDVPYRTGACALTDVHAGGHFFCVVYRECLQFSIDGKVRRWCELIDDSLPLDDEIEQLQDEAAVGTYGPNSQGYLECVFDDLTLTGMPCIKDSTLLAFHGFRKDARSLFSIVYTSGASEAKLGEEATAE